MTIYTLNPDKNFMDAIEILNRLNLNYLVLFGTLLGLIRDGELIEWDKDVDIVCVFRSKDEVDKIINLFRKFGFKGGFQRRLKPIFPALVFFREGGRKIDIEFVQTFEKTCYLEWYSIYVSVNSQGEATFLNNMYRAISRLPFNEGIIGSSHYQENHILLAKFSYIFAKYISFILKSALKLLNKDQKLIAEIPYECIKEKTTFNYHGKMCLIPKDPKCFLSFHYGQTWQKPIKSQRWTEYLKHK